MIRNPMATFSPVPYYYFRQKTTVHRRRQRQRQRQRLQHRQIMIIQAHFWHSQMSQKALTNIIKNISRKIAPKKTLSCFEV